MVKARAAALDLDLAAVTGPVKAATLAVVRVVKAAAARAVAAAEPTTTESSAAAK